MASSSSSSSSSRTRRASFSEDDGLASIAEYSGAGSHLYPFVSRIGFHTASLRLALPATAAHYCSSRFEVPHFLQSCSLCKKPLGSNRDIYMYRGDMPFCSEECREEQMEMDDAMEKTTSLSASKKAAMRLRRTQQDSSSSSSSQKYPLRPGITAA